ncbi:MAG: hypothetical protein KL863_07510 [Rhizobium sp.]|nr:hypothetical protein [Rhizobium sp.]
MIDTDDDLAEIERRMREKLTAPGKAKPVDETEKRMIARLLGGTTVAADFLRHENAKPLPGRKARPFRPVKPTWRFTHWESRDGWRIERYENGKMVVNARGSDFELRDSILIKLGAAGYTVTPMEVAGIFPRPIEGRAATRPKPKSQRMAIMARIASLDADDIADFCPADFEDWT